MRYLFGFLCVCALGVVLSLPALAHESDDKLGDPGFRPYSEYISAFLSAVDTATIAVYPTIVRKADGTSQSVESQKQIVALIRQKEMAAPVAGSSRVDLGKTRTQLSVGSVPPRHAAYWRNTEGPGV